MKPKSQTLLIWGTDGTVLHSTDLSTLALREHARRCGSRAHRLRCIRAKFSSLLASAALCFARKMPVVTGKRFLLPHQTIDLRAVVHHAPSGAWIAAGSRGTILRSTDGGKTWSLLPNELNLTLETLFVEPSSGALADRRRSWLDRSLDGCRRQLAACTREDAGRLCSGDRNPSAGSELIATSALGRFLISTDRGELAIARHGRHCVLHRRPHSIRSSTRRCSRAMRATCIRREHGETPGRRSNCSSTSRSGSSARFASDAVEPVVARVGHHGLGGSLHRRRPTSGKRSRSVSTPAWNRWHRSVTDVSSASARAGTS